MTNDQPLFHAELHYQPGAPAVQLHDGSSNGTSPLGSGEGVVRGTTLQGRVKWSLFEVQGPICETNLVGVITTEDGAQVEFETRGYGVVPDPSRPQLWDMPAVVRFWTGSPAYQWLNTTLAVWEGMFDMRQGVHTYQAYYQKR
ncbi:MAG TPA: DUF3237 family protein [Ktedonobacterales bacterium]|nr:DUF3237 family protein [Ktedonobacterales bacterium]